ncbi:hypothetical protein AcW1_007575 [Taiwanofungus camphoratus]|nr:hypothetical protein AcW2_007367 [Antrodia cinnamomea]KAI0927068.1 hypothetical protein AcV5_007702 [Antrodia cinnamomea]KAI0947324.1 hypothetical protein AcV7_009777 [Antrodia cinnamomea]KAI0953330.1 hypothetical protein AcW1_007575 [Antrodia cinnamomea]
MPSSSSPRFTFLATLFLLLFVSSAIVLRSFIVRRRFRRQIEEAIAAGVLLPSQGGPGSRRKLGEKPRLWDAVLVPSVDEKWENIMPVAAKFTTSSQEKDSTPSPGTPQEFSSQSSTSFFRNPFARRRAYLGPLLTPSASSTLQTSNTTPSVPSEAGQHDHRTLASEIQVSFLISMPNPHRNVHVQDGAGQVVSSKGKARSLSGYWDEEEEGVPDVVLGVAQVPYQKDEQGPEQ